jgi:ribosomal protein S18 acetylase RimI-like enzyme
MSDRQSVVIEHAANTQDLDVARELFREYEQSLGVDLGFQGFAAEVDGLPGAYAPPRGRLLIARDDGRPVGCVALRPLGDDVCEMKRLYLRPGLRGRGVGRMLAERVMDEARAIGYRVMRLDTLPSMADAFALYERLGFVPIAPYYPNPVPGTRYMERVL